MKMIEDFKQSWRDSFKADKVLFPSPIKRIGLYGLNAMGVLVVALGIYPLWYFRGERGIFLFLLMALFGLYIVCLSIVWWNREATRYIVKKEA